MSEDTKKNQQKSKHGAKEQRKPRQAQQQPSNEKSAEVKTGTPHEQKPKDSRGQPPNTTEPSPEFYKNLKRETDEILKITEEANSKYKKKEIQSNWSKYEMPNKSYDEVEQEENLGADYEKLIQAPQSIGGHFQFKHEKSWDISTGPSLYDKYFEINMDNLCTALSTIPFYERNDIDCTVFSQIDLQTMRNRSVRYKQKYFNDKSYTTAELDAQDKILSLMKENVSKSERENENSEKRLDSESKDIVFDDPRKTGKILEGSEKVLDVENVDRVALTEEIRNVDVDKTSIENLDSRLEDKDDLDDILLENVNKVDKSLNSILETKNIAPEDDSKKEGIENANNPVAQPTDTIESKGKSVIESPEDLEKWLDDFLDG